MDIKARVTRSGARREYGTKIARDYYIGMKIAALSTDKECDTCPYLGINCETGSCADKHAVALRVQDVTSSQRKHLLKVQGLNAKVALSRQGSMTEDVLNLRKLDEVLADADSENLAVVRDALEKIGVNETRAKDVDTENVWVTFVHTWIKREGKAKVRCIQPRSEKPNCLVLMRLGDGADGCFVEGEDGRPCHGYQKKGFLDYGAYFPETADGEPQAKLALETYYIRLGVGCK